MPRRPRAARAPKPKPDPLKWEVSDELTEVAAKLFARFEVHFHDLRSVRIGYLMITGGREPKRDRIDGVWARFLKVPEPYRTLTDLDAIVWVRYAIWKALSAEQRQALIAHQLTHGQTNDRGELVTVRHDLEDFAWVARQFGAWHENVELYGRQLSLFGQPDAKPDPDGDKFADLDAKAAEQRAEREGNVTPLRRPNGKQSQPHAQA